MTSRKSEKNKNNGASSATDGGASFKSSGIKKILITGLVTIFVLGGIILLYIFLPAYADKSDKDVLIKIPANASTEMVRDSVAKYLGPKYGDKVALVSKLRGTDYSHRHGAYLIEAGSSPLNAQKKLSRGTQKEMKVTVNNVRGLDILSERLSKNVDFTADSLKLIATDPEFLKEYNLSPEEALALFIDDTYFVFWSNSPREVAAKIGANYKKIWSSERLQKARNLGLSPAQVITLASIMDEETNKTDEKPQVARLYLNRLKKGMKLQADPTVKFALGDFSLRRIRSEHLKVDSPYNTYQISGLPPGPIRTVTVADIDAVLNAPEHNYLYMCAKEDFSGYHNFSSDYSTHMQNARKYQKALNQRGIK